MAKETSFGLKEVADVKLYPLTGVSDGIYVTVTTTADKTVDVKVKGDTGASTTDIAAAYTFDSLKVSNIEMSSEDTSARGGKGNPELIVWSYGKEITFTMEDALMSKETLELMFGAEKGSSTDVLTIGADTWSDNYALVGTTVMRKYADGQDRPFVFILPKVHISASGTLTMEAEGDPSTFEMTVKAMASKVDGKDALIEFRGFNGFSS